MEELIEKFNTFNTEKKNDVKEANLNVWKALNRNKPPQKRIKYSIEDKKYVSELYAQKKNWKLVMNIMREKDKEAKIPNWNQKWDDSMMSKWFGPGCDEELRKFHEENLYKYRRTARQTKKYEKFPEISKQLKERFDKARIDCQSINREWITSNALEIAKDLEE